jgi:hypothetical protein
VFSWRTVNAHRNLFRFSLPRESLFRFSRPHKLANFPNPPPYPARKHAKISAMEITEELIRREAWEEIKRIAKQAKCFVHAVRHDGERVCLWLLPEGGMVKVVELGDSPERRRLRVYLWKEEEFEQFSEKATLNKRRWFKDWKIKSVHVIEKNWTEEEREMVEEWEKKRKLLFEFIESFITEGLTKEDYEHLPCRHIVELPEDFWHWTFKKQVHFLLDDIYQKHLRKGERKGYWLFLRLRS